MSTTKFNKENNQGVNARSDAQETKKIFGRYRILINVHIYLGQGNK